MGFFTEQLNTLLALQAWDYTGGGGTTPPTPSSKKQLVFDGDSLQGYGADSGDPLNTGDAHSGTNWPTLLKDRLGSDWGDYRKYNVSGQKLSDMLTDYQTQVLPLRDAATYGGGQFLFPGGGINDILFGGDTGEQAFAKRKQYIDGALAAGWPYVVADTLNRGFATSGVVGTAEGFARIKVFNDLMRQYADQNPKIILVDFAADVRNDNPNDLNFRDDGLHFALGGATRKARTARTVLANFALGQPTPLAATPVLSYDSSAKVLTVTSPYPASQIYMAAGENGFVALTSKTISIAEGTYPEGHFRFAADMSDTYNVSLIARSAAISIAPPPGPTTKQVRYQEDHPYWTSSGGWSSLVQNGVEDELARYAFGGQSATFAHPNCNRIRYQCGRLGGFGLDMRFRIDGGAWTVISLPDIGNQKFDFDYKFDSGDLPLGPHTMDLETLGFGYRDVAIADEPV